MNEEWKDIPGYEGIYEASTLGRIRSNANKVTSNSRYSVRRWKQRIIKQKFQKRCTGKKDARVCLWKDGKEKTFLVARLIAMTWCDNYKNGMTVNHIDGNPENNRAENLEWMTLGENIRHGFDTGLYPQHSCVIIESDGTERHFRSYAEASRYLGKANGFVSELFKNGKDVQVGDRFVFPF